MSSTLARFAFPNGVYVEIVAVGEDGVVPPVPPGKAELGRVVVPPQPPQPQVIDVPARPRAPVPVSPAVDCYPAALESPESLTDPPLRGGSRGTNGSAEKGPSAPADAVSEPWPAEESGPRYQTGPEEGAWPAPDSPVRLTAAPPKRNLAAFIRGAYTTGFSALGVGLLHLVDTLMGGGLNVPIKQLLLASGAAGVGYAVKKRIKPDGLL